MQINKRNKFLFCIFVSFVLIIFLMTFSAIGCGRRALLREKLKSKAESEASQSASVQSDDNSETVEENAETEGEETIVEEESTSEESVSNEEGETSSDEAVEEEGEGETGELEAKIAANMQFVAAECGNIIGDVAYDDPVIYPGDSGADNLEVRGFISFDISDLLGAIVDSAKISGQSNNVSGTPFQKYGPIIIKAVYWGARAITPSDFNLDGIEITNISESNFGKNPQVLRDDLQNVVDSGINRYQLCFYFEMPQTDGDGQSDNIQYYLEDISLTVTYSK